MISISYRFLSNQSWEFDRFDSDFEDFSPKEYKKGKKLNRLNYFSFPQAVKN
jgi:hypothetical protein